MGILSFLPHPWGYAALIVLSVFITAVCVRRFVVLRRASVRGVDPWIVLLIGILFALVALTRDRSEPPLFQPNLFMKDVERPRPPR